MADRLRRIATSVGFALRHPRDAYRAVSERATGPTPSPREADPFDQAVGLLTGLDVGLAFERDGVSWTLPVGEDGVLQDVFRHGSYAGGTQAAVLRFVREQRRGLSWIIDVGANVGTTTVPFARAGYDVMAIEPVPSCLRYLRRNVSTNGLDDQVTMLEGAIASSPEVLIALSTSMGNSEVVDAPDAHAAFEQRYARGETIAVRGMGLDDAVASKGVDPAAVALVWCDVQGSETTVIETGASLWTAGVPLFAEFWLDGLAAHGGVDRFIGAATECFTTFVDGARGGEDLARALDRWDEPGGERRPVAELSELAHAVRDYPARFTDVLLIP